MENDIFDSVFSFRMDKAIPEKENISIERIKMFIQCVLDHHFGSGHKTKIEEYSTRFNFACPYCGDSNRDLFKKRGNLFFKNMMFKCFNCSRRESLYYFLKDYQEYCNISDEDLYVFKTFQTSVSVQNKKELTFFDMTYLKKYGFTRTELRDLFGFIDIKGTKGEKFLNDRYQKNLDNFLYYPLKDSLIILNGNNDIILGYQLRPLRYKKYYTYKLSKIYEEAKREVTEEVKKLDDISSVFNILRINFNIPVTVFEGPMDSFLYGNSIAISGAHNILSFDVENMKYWFDNDDTGKKKAIEKLKEGYEVFLWKKYLRDVDVYRDMKDLNDLVTYSKQNNIKLLPFDNYFSNNKLNLFYV